MKSLRDLVAGIQAILQRKQQIQELDEELRNYLEAAAAEKMRRGMSYDQAMRAARVDMGSIQAVNEEVRSANWEWAVETLWQDIRYGARQLVRSPGFSAVAILTLALGIGANTAIFTLVHGVMLKQLPVDKPEQLYRVGEGEFYCCEWGGLQDSWGTFDYQFYKHVRDTNPSFERVAAFSGNAFSFSVRRTGAQPQPQTIDGEYVSGNYFDTIGVHPAAGRLLTPFDDRPDSPTVAVLGHRAWQRYYAADPSVIGSRVLINDLPVEVVGIAPPEYSGARLTNSPPELWIPLNQQPTFDGPGQKSLLHSPGMAWLYVFGRLKPGVEPIQAQAQLSVQLQQWLRSQGRRDDDRHKIDKQEIRLIAGGTGVSSFRSNSRNGLYLLSAASVLVLLIACANLANLLLARSAFRRQQIALRLSLGATRSRLICAALTESVMLSILGGAAGLLLAYAGTQATLAIVFRGASYVPVSAAPSLPVLGFALLISILTGIVFGIAPAWIATYTAPSEGLRITTRTATNQSSRQQNALIIVQAALSIVLLAVAGLVTQSLRNLENANLGFDARGKLLARISFGAAGYKPEQLAGLYRLVQERLEQIPGVRSAGLSLNSPQELCCVNVSIAIGGRTDKWIQDVNVVFGRVSPHYFSAIGTPLVRGRVFTDQDTSDTRLVAVVDQNFARKFFPGEDPIGKRFGLRLQGHSNDYEIVGVVQDTVYRSPAAVPSPMYFLPLNQTRPYNVAGYDRLETATRYAHSIQLSVDGRPESYETPLRSVLASINPSLSPISVRAYTEHVAVQYNQQRLIARLTAVFSLLALLLASVGLYGVTAYNVTRRTGEIGIRMALGAARGTVLKMVLRTALSYVLLGIAIGVPLAIVCGRYLAHSLYGVAHFNPFVLGIATTILLLCASVAAFIPGRRAASIEPLNALRAE